MQLADLFWRSIVMQLLGLRAMGSICAINQLEERILSAVSQQVQVIWQGLGIELVGKILRINIDMGFRRGRGREEVVAFRTLLRSKLPFIQSVTVAIVPKLVADNVPLLINLLADVFTGVDYIPVDFDALGREIFAECKERRLVNGERWISKLQLYHIQKIQRGLMMVGPSGSGKTNAWQVLLAALERLDRVGGIAYVIDLKDIHKDALYGTLDSTTREWNDGLFTHVSRKVADDVRGESGKQHWITFDMDVDPEWVESLNSVLDDNKLLTQPNGERLNLPPNVRIMFEVEHLKYLTLATSTILLDVEDEEAGEIIARRTDALSDNAASANLVKQEQAATIHERYAHSIPSSPINKTRETSSSTTYNAPTFPYPLNGSDSRPLNDDLSAS
ncbi:Cytoplasmic dynein 1 heavy chain 1 [Marasmius tenuissimus]|nr:Cytoplasmic dynein 1 heavy chain 1 [Marasmius tenuissimus]